MHNCAAPPSFNLTYYIGYRAGHRSNNDIYAVIKGKIPCIQFVAQSSIKLTLFHKPTVNIRSIIQSDLDTLDIPQYRLHWLLSIFSKHPLFQKQKSLSITSIISTIIS
ncbi:hypothetical protein TWF173_004923 [Orbilia oligospora]|nr:hypothetical protein TWF173_004923 [Orbilia oligospora]